MTAVLQIMLPAGSKRDSIPVQCHLGKEVQLKHHAPVISITVLDAQVRFKSGSFARNWLWNSNTVYVQLQLINLSPLSQFDMSSLQLNPLPAPLMVENNRAKPADMSGHHKVSLFTHLPID